MNNKQNKMIEKEDLIGYSPTKTIKRWYDYHPPIITEDRRKKAQEIIEQSCQILKISEEEFANPIKSNKRVSNARHMIVTVLFHTYEFNSEEISQVINRHRATVNHSIEVSRKMRRVNLDFKEQLEELKQSLK